MSRLLRSIAPFTLAVPFTLPTILAASAIIASVATPAAAATPRETLIRAAFATHDKAQALDLVNQAIADTNSILARDPGNHEARLQQALGIGYRGQLKRSPSDAKAAKRALDALAASDPRDPETLVAVGGWHLTAISDLGSFLARTLLGANRDEGMAALNKSIALGGNNAFFPAYAALIHIRLDTADTAAALVLAQRAAADAAPSPIDRIMQRAAVRIIPMLQAGDGSGAAKAAKQMLPFGSLS